MFKGISFESESEPIDKFRDSARRMLDEELIRQGKVLRDLCDKGELGSEVDEYIRRSISLVDVLTRIIRES